jgi:hypothetical protein
MASPLHADRLGITRLAKAALFRNWGYNGLAGEMLCTRAFDPPKATEQLDRKRRRDEHGPSEAAGRVIYRFTAKKLSHRQPGRRIDMQSVA